MGNTKKMKCRHTTAKVGIPKGLIITVMFNENAIWAPKTKKGHSNFDGNPGVIFDDVDGNNEDMPISRVVRLVDVNSDGIMDESTVFLDKLVLPRAIALSHEGILLIAPPDLLYCRDTDGDGKCDNVKKVASGFSGLDSIEHAGNGMLYGLDNVFHNFNYKRSFLSLHNLLFHFFGR